jgi:DMSO/TMAO reductase YedYZ molybdopterin-dependent catalytic subunit
LLKNWHSPRGLTIVIDKQCPAGKKKHSRRAILKAGAAAGIGLAGASLAGCIGGSKIEINGTETRTYEGQSLSSARDFRDQTISADQRIDAGAYTLSITGRVSAPKTFSYDDVLRFPHFKKVVRLSCVEGWDVTALWEGVLLRDLIDEAGPLPGAGSVIFRTADGDSTSLDLDYIVGRGVMLAFRINDVPLPPERGYPFRVIAEDKWGYKWAKWVTGIELAEFGGTGYWEARGYSSNGDLNQSFLS